MMVWDLAVQAEKSHSDSLCAMYMVIKWQTQKSNINGQLVTFGRAKIAYLCPVRVSLRFQERAQACWVFLALVLLQSMTPPSICALAPQGCTVIPTRRIWRSIHCNPSELVLVCFSTNWASWPPLSRIAFVGDQIPLWTIYVIHPHCNVACSVSMIGSCLFVCFVG